VAEIPTAYPESVEGFIVEVPVAGEQLPEVLPAFAVQGDYFPVEDHFLYREFLAHPIAELVESLEDVPAFRPEVAALLVT
jgi:hypothetical protein